MKIELKNIQHSERLSEETDAFAATLYIDGYKAGEASNRGHGGPTDYHAFNEKGRELIKQAEEYCKTLPPVKFKAGNEEHELKMDLELYIGDLLEKHLQQKDLQKFRNKITKASANNIVIGIPDEAFRTLRLRYSIDLLLSHRNGPGLLKDFISNKVLPALEKNERVLNCNIPEQLLKDAGLKDGQYLREDERMGIQKKTRIKKGRIL